MNVLLNGRLNRKGRRAKMSSKFFYKNFHDYLDDPATGESYLLSMIQDFKCTPNPDVEHFLKHNAVDFTKKHQSVTYLVYPVAENIVVGYFSITIKPLVIKESDIPSNTQRRQIERMCRLDKDKHSYTLAAYLIAQLGKNFSDGINNLITGKELLNVAFDVIRNIRRLAGGTIVFVETQDSPKLIDFYEHNHFHSLEERKETTGNGLTQLYRII